ncbi:hypothetical protein BY458DRAFT_441127, partial [Sporodiniella umbellata]
STSEPSALVGTSARVVLSDDEEEEGNLKYTSDGDDDEHGAEPVSAEAVELLETEKTWKKRWFVLRTTKLAMYKDRKEYKLLRLIDLHEIHKVVQVTTKHKYKFVFAFVTAKRMYYVQAQDQNEMNEWFALISQAKEDQRLYDADDDTSSMDRDQEFAKDVISLYKSNHHVMEQHRKQSNLPSEDPSHSRSPPINIPAKIDTSRQAHGSSTPQGDYYPFSPSSDPHWIDGVASSEDDEEYGVDKANIELEENRNRVLIEGYLLKLGRNKGWRKRWFVLRTDTLAYYEDEKEYSPHRIIPLDHILDSLEINPAWLNALVVATRRASKESPQDYVAPSKCRTLSLIPENTVEKMDSVSASIDSMENISHLSGISGAGGVGGAGGALGSSQSATHSKASERLGRGK